MAARAETEWDSPVDADCSCGDAAGVGGEAISVRDPVSSLVFPCLIGSLSNAYIGIKWSVIVQQKNSALIGQTVFRLGTRILSLAQ